MTTAKRPPFHLPTENIQQWQISTCEDGEVSLPTATISALYNGIVGFLRVVTDNVRKNEPCPSYFSTLEQAVAALFFWGRDFGVPQGELDTALQFSNRLRDTVLSILTSLGDLLSMGLIKIIAVDAERNALLRITRLVSLNDDAKLLLDEPLEPASYEGESIDRLCVTLHNMADSLKILGSSLDFVADDEFDDEESKVWGQLQDRSAHEYFVDLISSRFPLASNQLVQALGQSNWDRYNYVKTLRENAIEESGVISGEKAISEFHDSGIGTSAAAQSSLGRETRSEYAATVVSSRAESSHKRLPPLPEAGRSGEAFECEVCNRKVQIQRTREWKKHVFEDICAYTCVFPECSSSRVLFRDRKAMTHHLASHHDIPDTPGAHSCPLCLEEIIGDRDIISLHFARHMEEIALGILPQSTDSDDDSEQSDDDEVEMLPSTVPEIGNLDVPFEPSAGVALATDNPSLNLDSQDHLDTSRSCAWVWPDSDPLADSEEGYDISCVCGYREDDGNTVLCEECGTWQHIQCFYRIPQSVPDVHLCVDCNPREIDPTLIKDIRNRISLMDRKILRLYRQVLRSKAKKASGVSKVDDGVSRHPENSRQSVDPSATLSTYTIAASVASLPPLTQLNIPSSDCWEKDTASNTKGEPTTEQQILRNASQHLDPSGAAQRRAYSCVPCFNIHVDCDKGYPSCGGCIARMIECTPQAFRPTPEKARSNETLPASTKHGVPVAPNEDSDEFLNPFKDVEFTRWDYTLLADLRHGKNLTWEQIADFFPGKSPEVLESFFQKELRLRNHFDTLGPIGIEGKHLEQTDPLPSIREQDLEQTEQLPSIRELVSEKKLPWIREAQINEDEQYIEEVRRGVPMPNHHPRLPGSDDSFLILNDPFLLEESADEAGQATDNAVVQNNRPADRQYDPATQELRDQDTTKQQVSPAARLLEEAALEFKDPAGQQELVKEAAWRLQAEVPPNDSREAVISPERRSASPLPSMLPSLPKQIEDSDDILPGVTQDRSNTASATTDLPEGWYQARDNNGRHYYYNVAGHAQWDRPHEPYCDWRVNVPTLQDSIESFRRMAYFVPIDSSVEEKGKSTERK